MAASPTPRQKRVEALGRQPSLTSRQAPLSQAGLPAAPGAQTDPALQALKGFFLGAAPTLPVAVAFSGGADSTALLLAAHALWPGQITALHVHHGLQAAADDFQRHCEEFCRVLGISLQVLRVQAQHRPGESPEDAARRARYSALALAALQAGASGVLLGQHADDQVETLLIALSRGAGLPGLSAMAAQFERHGMVFWRPLLGLPGEVLRQGLAQSGHAFVNDPSNTDTHFTRNRLRAQVLPALAQALPQFRQTFARSARHAAQAQALLSELAAEDLGRVGNPPAIKALQALSPARQGNVLRHWLASGHATRPSAAQLDQLLAQIAVCTTRGHRIHLRVAGGHVWRRAGVLAYEPLADGDPPAPTAPSELLQD